ncbi:TlpA disulfide reductase family protein [Solibacillus sp. CAU 1738]|uniref:TlpA family protein disulfide reductase n=1 Tax=Solibacillus sp. CAU 1738 TaxID=3140363 RepID=UPI003260733C
MKLRTEMPEFEGATAWLNRKVGKGDLRGPTLIHFWSISCSLCKELLPKLYELANKYNINMVAVHMPRSENDKNIVLVKEVARKLRMKEAMFIDDHLNLTQLYQTRFVPTYYLFDEHHLLRHVQIAGSMRFLESKIQRLLKEAL